MNQAAVPENIPHSDTLEWAVLEDGTDEAMAAASLRRAQTLVQLRRELPLDAGSRRPSLGVTTRPFEADRDSADLLAVNNAAFDWHPEQGHWDQDQLRSALAQTWVDPAGILVHDGDDGHIDGFCWTRVHPDGEVEDLDGRVGEIWVIGVDPQRHRRGLGAALVAAGLDHLSALGLSVAMLFTEESNVAARRMYDRMGFHLHERRGGYR